jgi:hypothetical protein
MLCLVVRSITRVLRSRSRRLSVLSVWNNLDMAGLLSIRFISSILTMAIQTNVLFLKDVKNRIDQLIEKGHKFVVIWTGSSAPPRAYE